MTTKIYLISPREPCGATWLINCLLVLGIKTYRRTVGDDMWLPRGGEWTLNPLEEQLKKWLPALSEAPQLRFRDDLEVEWAHIWPTGSTANARIIYFIRDPRDALFSRYRREAPDASFGQFLAFPDTRTLLDKVENWNLFNEVWLAQPDLAIVRFEDYKQDALATLRSAVAMLGLAVSESALTDAVTRSGFERAAAAEKRYREEHPEDTQVINRASQVGSWQDPSLAAEAADIADRCGALMARFGYLPAPARAAPPRSYRPQSDALRFFRILRVPAGFWERPDDGNGQARLGATAALSSSLDAAELEKYRLPDYERWQLLGALREFARSVGARLGPQLEAMQANPSTVPNLGWRINEFLALHALWIPDPIKISLRKFVRLARFAVFRVSR